MERSGICVAGNMIVDVLYPITLYPTPGELARILDPIERSTGGCLCNVAIDLAKLDPSLSLTAFGRIGRDEEGEFILNKLLEHSNIDTTRIKREGNTPFTAVMSDERTKQRTFFHYRGANAFFCEEDLDYSGINPKMLHIGYIMLLDTLDQEDGQYGTKMARLLHNAQQGGMMTSIDLVSDKSGEFSKIVPPSLRYTDFCTINELEAELTTGISLRGEDGLLLEKNMRPALKSLFEMGVSRWAVIHSIEGCFGMTIDGEYVSLESLKLPEGFIKGSVGAGDAFCSGVIYAAYKGKPLREGLELGIASAACSLSEYNATGGVVSADEAMRFYRDMR